MSSFPPQLAYPASIQQDHPYFVVTFRDFPNVRICEKTSEKALLVARDVLGDYLVEITEDELNNAVAKPSSLEPGEVLVSLDVVVSSLVREYWEDF